MVGARQYSLEYSLACKTVNNYYILWLSELLFIGSLAQVFFKVVVSFAFMLICADLNPHILP